MICLTFVVNFEFVTGKWNEVIEIVEGITSNI